MIKKVLFNSSLPRAGSTLFQNIVSDNPEFYCTPTSGLADYVLGAKQTHSNSQAVKAQDKEAMENAFLGFCRAGIQGYFNNLTSKQLILDKSRDWGINYNLLEMITPEPKIICMVRDLRAVYASMEKNFRKNPHRDNHIQNPINLVGTTLRKRIDIWASGVPVGVAIDRLRDVIDQQLDKKILFIRYEDLMEFPEQEMKRFYDYIEMPYFEGHQFETVTQHTQENDLIHGIYGDHTLRQKFEKQPDDFDEVLGFEICRDIKNTYKWFYDYFGYV
jgi:sulfotransferase